MAKPYRDYSDFLSEHFPYKVQKLAVNAGFTCPNRDGTKGYGGCTYCNNQTFNPAYCTPRVSIRVQIEEGKRFFARKYPEMRFLAYFQAYTNTHADTGRLMALYDEALSQPGVVGLIIGTRPDCITDDLLQQLSALANEKFVMIEYGAETSHDATLDLINRCHTWRDTTDAVMRTSRAGIACGLHLILGLPGETVDMMTETVTRASTLPIATLKLHQLQLVKGTRMAKDVTAGIYDIPRFTANEYIDLCIHLLRHISPSVAIERFVSQSPAELLIYPRWGLKNYEFTNLLNRRLKETGARQGELFAPIQT
ncbi:MAG: TIGR01212 family radical SAM protein [Pseudoflavonifractor sp.]|nr:TIGR01212 family radical SAM protein [Pseudoflavonifractor sp.]